jgi:hypothetical protein
MSVSISFWHHLRCAFGGKPMAASVVIMTLCLLPATLNAQDTTQIDCETLMGMPLLDFQLTDLPDGFLECMDGHPADVWMMRKWANILSSERGDDYTIGEMKQVIDSVDRATGYRDSYDRLMECRVTLERTLAKGTWPADSVRLLGCGQDPTAVLHMGRLVRKGEVAENATLLQLIRTYQSRLPGILESLSKRVSLDCPDTLRRDFAFGLQAFGEPQAALACARENNKPVFFLFGGWVQASTTRLSSGLLKDAALWSRITQETVVMVLYADDGTEMAASRHFEDPRMDTLVHTNGLLAQSWALKTMDIRNPMGIALLRADGQVIAYHVGTPSKEELLRMLDEAKQ